MDQAELLGAGVTLLFLGAVAGMCVWCPRLGTRRSKQIFYEQRYLDEGRQSFAVSRTFSIAGMEPVSADYSTIQCPEMRKDKWLYSKSIAEDPDTSRYQNLKKGSRRESETAYIEPISTDYYNCGPFQSQPKDDDTISYENVLICKPLEEVIEESEDYQNSASIEQWQQSMKMARSIEEDDSSEPDYVNGEVTLMQQ